MKYRESSTDKKLRSWFSNDNTRQLLKKIHLQRGSFRGLNQLNIDFEYPLTAISGRNGSGKSTILALACCAFHNSRKGFKLPKRKLPYYTFSDFFIQHAQEVPPSGISILYYIAHNRWKKTDKNPESAGVRFQVRHKKMVGSGTITIRESPEMLRFSELSASSLIASAAKASLIPKHSKKP